ncbi:MAG TPA: cob(I)yrinic acid a,c-diamide adenosyltransferase [Spirochaetales bacterium]|nr:cob(I)yrinic acid a,c-diamide adenosyltransferase [Spirochaetales bacterium]HOV94450.1 cob(I)yrinic acid a,c-diamide adenosyltransferase [Spirochaetales bacterium]HPS14203.1 cob(I)yrinic acid a,c-diamide adenosyltransferase [Spirochaetales bacterium]
MSIVTKSGDEGQTDLWSGERVNKDSLRVEAYGTVDELSSSLGMARHLCGLSEVRAAIDEIQRLLFRVGAQLASPSKPVQNPITSQDVEDMSAKIFALEEKIVIKSFVVPGMTAGSAALDISRTIARRAERRIVSLSHTEDVSRDLQKLINRLSDYLFMLARDEEDAAGKLTFVN